MPSNIIEAFFAALPDATPSKAQYVSLYRETPFYGGPEEGGWWGCDDDLIAYHPVVTEEEAEVIKARIEALAEKLGNEARYEYHRKCRDECVWLDARGLDADFLIETSGPTRYWVATETTPGSFNSRGCRHYE